MFPDVFIETHHLMKESTRGCGLRAKANTWELGIRILVNSLVQSTALGARVVRYFNGTLPDMLRTACFSRVCCDVCSM
jgi:hypothetical protein